MESTDLSSDEQFREFKRAAGEGNLVPLYERLFSDQLTPVVAYRCLVEEDDHELPSLLFESVVKGDQTVRTISVIKPAVQTDCCSPTMQRRAAPCTITTQHKE